MLAAVSRFSAGVRSIAPLARLVSTAIPPVAAAPSRSAEAERATDARLGSIFYDPKIQLTKRQRQVYSSLEDEPPLPLMEDHGHLYRTSAAQMEGRNEMVRRAVSTRTGGIQAMLAFRRSEILKKYSAKPFDTGASRVQVAMVTERINRIAAHLSRNKHDKNCKRSLTSFTVRRRKVLEYMMRRDYQNYRLMVTELGLRPLNLVNSRHLPKVRAETHKQVKERHARLKNRVSRGHRGH